MPATTTRIPRIVGYQRSFGICSVVGVAWARSDEIPRVPYSSFAGLPDVTQSIWSWTPFGPANWRTVSPPVRLGPYAPPPWGPGGGPGPGFSGSKKDQFFVWHRAHC